MSAESVTPCPFRNKPFQEALNSVPRSAPRMHQMQGLASSPGSVYLLRGLAPWRSAKQCIEVPCACMMQLNL